MGKSPFTHLFGSLANLLRVNIQNVVDPLIIYAELIYSNNNRNIETAQILFNEYIKPNL